MTPLAFTATLAPTFAQLVLSAGLAVMVVGVVVGWARHATKTDEDAPDE